MTETLTAGAEYGADALIMCDNLVRIYQVENIEVQALQGLDLLVTKGEMIAIVGQSGSGKSTLLNVLSGLDVPTAGAARVAGWDLLRMSHADRLTYRRSVVGFVWQQTARNLLPYLSARENVMLPMAFTGLSGSKRIKRANELLAAMGMADKGGRRPHQLSGGEQQRVAIATALANSPEVIFADEPTGELDSATGDDVFEALRSANRDLGATVVVVTHDNAVSSQVQRTVAIRDGRTATEVVRRTHIGADGRAETLHEEYAVLDRAGRLQIPKDYRNALGLKDRVRLDLEDDHLGVWADGAPRKPKKAPAAAESAVAEPGSVPAPDIAAPVAAAAVATPVVIPAEPTAEELYYSPPAQELPAVVESPSKPAMPTPMGGLPKVTFQEAPAGPSAHHVASVQEASRRASAYQPSIDALAESDPYRPVFAPREDDAPANPEPPAQPEPRAYTEQPDKKPVEPRMPWLPIGEGDD
jgi:ABC-type lipoprotein export system ATPase subunit